MNKKQKNNLIILVFVFVFLLLIRKSKNEEPNMTEEDLVKSINEPKEIAVKKEPYLYEWLAEGSRGESVKRLQQRLNLIYNDLLKYRNNKAKWDLTNIYEKRDIGNVIYKLYDGKNLFPLKVDGIFGRKTLWAVYEVQRISEREWNVGTNLYLTRKDHWLWLDYLSKMA